MFIVYPCSPSLNNSQKSVIRPLSFGSKRQGLTSPLARIRSHKIHIAQSVKKENECLGEDILPRLPRGACHWPLGQGHKGQSSYHVTDGSQKYGLVKFTDSQASSTESCNISNNIMLIQKSTDPLIIYGHPREQWHELGLYLGWYGLISLLVMLRMANIHHIDIW